MPADRTDPRNLVGQARVRIYSGALGFTGHLMAEGDVIAYCDTPTLMLRHDDGTQSSWSTTLPREIVQPAESAVAVSSTGPHADEPAGLARAATAGTAAIPDAAVDAYATAEAHVWRVQCPKTQGEATATNRNAIRAGLAAALQHLAAQALRTYADQQHPHAVGHAQRVDYGTGVEYSTECAGCGSSWNADEGGCTERVELLRASYALVNPPGPDCNCHETGAPCDCADEPAATTTNAAGPDTTHTHGTTPGTSPWGPC